LEIFELDVRSTFDDINDVRYVVCFVFFHDVAKGSIFDQSNQMFIFFEFFLLDSFWGRLISSRSIMSVASSCHFRGKFVVGWGFCHIG